MYRVANKSWMDRLAENTQLYQIISVQGDTLRYEAYTVLDELYDAFDLVKQPDAPNLFVPRLPPGVPERTHENTIPYRMDGP